MPVPVLVHDRLAQRLEARAGGDGFAGEGGGDDLAELAVAFGQEVDAVEGQRGFGLRVAGLGGREEIDKGNLLFRGDLLDRAGVKGEVDVVGRAVGEVGAFQVLVGDRGKEHEARGGLAVELDPAVTVDHRAEVALELGEATFAGEGLVVAEEDEHDIGLAVGEVLLGRGEALVARAGGDGVTGDREVAEGELPGGRLALDKRFHPAVVLHAVGQAVPDRADDVVVLERELGVAGAGTEEQPRQRGGEQVGKA